MENDNGSMFYKSQEYHEARMAVAADFCCTALQIPTHVIRIIKCNMCLKPEKDKIMWSTVPKDFALQMFIAAACMRNDHAVDSSSCYRKKERTD